MATGSLARVVPRLLAVGLTSDAASDADLLEQFIAGREQMAFEALVRRHGPMVFAVGRRVLRHTQDAEDAFQATFLVLARKAATVSPRSNLAAWLHGVAHKTALKARQRAARRFEVETRVPPREAEPMHPDTNWAEVEPLLDQEIAALPDHYRLPIVLCDLEDRPRAEVASTLGCSEGTLSSRLTRGRRLLADRLNRRGVSLLGAALTVVLTGRTTLAEPLIRATVPVALVAGSRGAVSPSVAELATGVMKSMFLKKLRAVALVAVAAFALAGVAYRGAAAPVPANAPVPAADPKANTELPADADGRLLMNRKVLKDLKCDLDQFDRIMDLLEDADKKANAKTSEAMGQVRFNAGGGPPNFEAMKQKMQEAQEAGEKEFRKAVGPVIADMLTPAQKKRFREIDLQARGHDSFTTPAVVKALEITDKQKQQFEANAKQVEDDVASAPQRPAAGGAGAAAGGGGPGGAVVVNSFNSTDYEKAVREARAEGMKRALAILTDEQKAAWKKLSGEPFAYPLPLPASAMKGIRTGGFGVGGAGVRPLPPGVPAPVPPPAR